MGSTNPATATHLTHPHRESEWPNTDPTTGLVGPSCPICPQLQHVSQLLATQLQDPTLVQHIEQQTAEEAQIPPWRREDPAQAAYHDDDEDGDDDARQAARTVQLDLYRQRQDSRERPAAREPREEPPASPSASAPAQAEEMQTATSSPGSRRASGTAVSSSEGPAGTSSTAGS
ncbi:MAG: hypothetical protein Q9167_004546 [Letrouitia subvulpina]